MFSNQPKNQPIASNETLGALSLGRTNNFRLAFFEDTSAAVDPGREIRTALGSLWTEFAKTDNYYRTRDLLMKLQAGKEQILPNQRQRELILGRSFAELEKINFRIESELGQLGSEVRQALDECFDMLVAKGADPKILSA